MGAASIVYWLQDYQQAETYCDEAIRAAEDLKDTRLLAEALYGQAYTYAWQRRFGEARSAARQSYAAFEEPNDSIGMRQVLTVQGDILWMTGDLAGSVQTNIRVRELSTEQGDLGEALAMDLSLSLVFERRGMHAEAASSILHVLDHYERLGDTAGMVMALDWLSLPVVSLAPDVGLLLAGAVRAAKVVHGGSIDLTGLGFSSPEKAGLASFDEMEVSRLINEGEGIDLQEAAAMARTWAEQAGIGPAEIDLDLVVQFGGEK